jgi:pyruvate dehydrogenase E2 component (dihydrolipoyllysine-residue acetyltransferase)
MARSKREIPHYYVGTQIDVSSALAWLQDANARRPVSERILPAAMLLRAVALTARAVPELNGFWTDGGFLPGQGIHLGVAVSLREGGLVAPAIHDADCLGLGELMASLRDLVQRARAGRLRSSEMSDPTITVTNLGDQGVEVVHGVIYPPQVALVGLGRIVERPWAEGGMIGARPVLTATLAADHRATDGHVGARFLATLDRQLHHPEEL